MGDRRVTPECRSDLSGRSGKSGKWGAGLVRSRVRGLVIPIPPKGGWGNNLPSENSQGWARNGGA